MVRTLIVDANSVMGIGLRSLLHGHAEIEVVDGTPNGDPVANVVGTHRPDVILLSESPPATDRIRALARHGRGARILVLTSTTEPSVLSQAVAAGAHSCVLHGHFEPRELAGLVLATASGRSCLSTPVLSGLVTWLHAGASRPSNPGLTPREREIMKLIIGGLTNRGIADRLVISEKTVKNHVHSIYKRLGAAGRDHAVKRWHDLRFGDLAEH